MHDPEPEPTTTSRSASTPWQTPGFELISLDCEITAYAPDGDVPLF